MQISSSQLLPKHFHVALDFLSDATLSINLDVESAEVFQLDELLIQVVFVL